MEYDNCDHPRWTVERRMVKVLGWPEFSREEDCDVTERMVMLTRLVVEAAHGLGMPWPNVWRGVGGIIVEWRGEPVGSPDGETWRRLSVDVEDDLDGEGSVGCLGFYVHRHSTMPSVISTWNEANLSERMAVAAAFWRGESLAWVHDQSGTYKAPSLFAPDRCDPDAPGPYTCNSYHWRAPTPLPREALCRHG